MLAGLQRLLVLFLDLQIHLFPIDSHVFGYIQADLYLLTLNTQDLQFDIIAQVEAFSRSPGQNQHIVTKCFLRLIRIMRNLLCRLHDGRRQVKRPLNKLAEVELHDHRRGPQNRFVNNLLLGQFGHKL